MTTRFMHPFPFGAQIVEDGVRFRLWAPGQRQVALALSEATMPMNRGADGWFETTAGRQRPGTPYSFVLDDGLRVPDPASRAQQDDVHGPSLIVDPTAYEWRNGDWPGRPWEETVLYELHTGTFTPDGSFDGVRRKLDHLARTGITAVELMPVADFSGGRGWGYDGVLPFAPDRAYGAHDDLKRLVDEAHGRGLMVFLDVVYNHFGPDGNYLHLLAPDFFTERHHTPWGAAIDFGRPQVRDFFIHNALYWLHEYRFDGLRFDAVHAILDDGTPHFLTELAETVRRSVEPGRHVHLVLENDANEAHHLRRDGSGAAPLYTAQWNDDYHHVAHVLLTGEEDGYYGDYATGTAWHLTRALGEGFVYQGEPSPHRDGAARGEPSADLPPVAMVDFIQNHDQIGNRALGDRLTTLAPPEAVRAALALLLLAPQIPMLYMGEEWGATEPFPFFCDFHDELADAVREGRRREFAGFARFADAKAREAIPDPNAEATFHQAVLAWPDDDPERLREIRRLLQLRHARLVPRLRGTTASAAEAADGVVRAVWVTGDGSRLAVLANMTAGPARVAAAPPGDTLYETHGGLGEAAADGTLPPWAVLWCLDPSPSVEA